MRTFWVSVECAPADATRCGKECVGLDLSGDCRIFRQPLQPGLTPNALRWCSLRCPACIEAEKEANHG